MKKLVFIAVITFFSSCQEEGALTKGSASNELSSSALLKYHGFFEPTNGINVTGGVKIFWDGGKYKLQLDDFSISDGPDLKVYLSKAAMPTEFVNLGNLFWQHVYVVPDAVNVAEYPYVLIHCQQYNHLFAVAPLIPD